MSEIKVGDTRKWAMSTAGRIFTINYVGKTSCFFTYSDGDESSADIDAVLENSLPYTPPKQPEKWYMVVYKIKSTNKPFISSLLYTSVEEFRSSYHPTEGELEWVKLAEVKFNEE